MKDGGGQWPPPFAFVPLSLQSPWVGGRHPERSSVMALRSGVYIVPTNRWYIERTVWLIAGIVLLTFTTLAATVNPYFVLGVIATALSSIAVSLTGFCIVGNILAKLGFTPNLARPDWKPGKLY